MENYIFGKNNNEECSSGCDSGWTSYLQHSTDSQTDHYFSAGRLGFGESNRSKQLLGHEVVMSEEDTSMVSDASSGPAHHYNLHHHQEQVNAVTDNIDNNSNICNFYCDFVSATANSFDCSENKKKSNKQEKRRRRKVVVQDLQSSLLDDTASSSPCLDFSNNNASCRVSSFRSCKMIEENNVSSEYSQAGYSTTHYKVRPEHSVHDDYFKSGIYKWNKTSGFKGKT